MHSKGIPHGDIRGHNIFIKGDLNNNYTFKLIDLTVTGKINYQFQEFQKKIQRVCTLAPEEVQALKIDYVMYDQQKADVFQAGMCLLQTATLSSCPLVNFMCFRN